MSVYNMPENSIARRRDDEYVLQELVRLVATNFWWMLAIVFSISLASVLYVKLTDRVYLADALVQLDVRNPDGTNNNASPVSSVLQPIVGFPLVDAEIQIIQSRAVLNPVIDRFRLNISSSPRVFPILGEVSSWFARPGHPTRAPSRLQSYAWGGEILEVDSLIVPAKLENKRLVLRALKDGWYVLFDPDSVELVEGRVGATATDNGVTLNIRQLVAHPGTEFFLERYSELEASRILSSNLRVDERTKDSGIVDIAYSGPNPLLVTQIANAVATSYLKQRTERAQEEAGRMLTFLNAELPRVRDELRASEIALAQHQRTASSFQPTQEAQTYLSGSLEYQRQIAALRVQRAQLLTRFTHSAPEIQAFDSQLALLEAEKARLENRFSTLPPSEREAVSLERDARANAQIYVTLLNKVQELSISRAGTVGNVHIVDMAAVPSTPIKPKSALIIGAGTLLGIMTGILFAYLRASFVTGVSDPERLERRFGLSVLGVIPFSKEQARADRKRLSRNFVAALANQKSASSQQLTEIDHGITLREKLRSSNSRSHDRLPPRVSIVSEELTQPLLAVSHPFDSSIESLRGLRAALQFALVDAPNRTITITSPAPSDGKSFLAVNLAALLAESGKRVLLIDADLRRGSLSRYLGRSSEGGLTELLIHQATLEDTIGQTGVRGLHFIGTGASAPNPSDVITFERFASLLEILETQFDLVIVDTPPLLAVPDAEVIASLAGSTALCLRAGEHSERIIADSIKKLDRARARVIGCIVNAMPAKKRWRNGNYDYEFADAYSLASLPRNRW
jgi:tyrosine-protein kinase Etk/Wzc